MSDAPPDHRYLRSALEFAVDIAREGAKRRPPLAIPDGLRRFTKSARLPAGALGQVRRVIEAEDEFRRVLGIAATPELVDEIGRLWLQRPDGWRERIDELVAHDLRASEIAETEAAVRREQRRREAAEQVAVRSRSEIAAMTARIEQLDADLTAMRRRIDELVQAEDEVRAELRDARLEARHARDRERAAVERAERLEANTRAAADARDRAEAVRDEVLAERVVDSEQRARLAQLAALARRLADGLDHLDAVGAGRDEGSTGDANRRTPIPVPGGLAASATASIDHLLRSGAAILVDGYNVSMLGWPGLDLEAQRNALVDLLEAVTSRTGAEISVVFDGAAVVGAVADRRRSVRVVYSPPGVIADDVIRSEVDRLPASRHVVVVTSDAEIVRDVRAKGANTVASDRFLDVARS